jgi:hypothetical protein
MDERGVVRRQDDIFKTKSIISDATAPSNTNMFSLDKEQ